jgi:hypothetical protein
VTGDLAAVDVQDLAGDVWRGLQGQNAVYHVTDPAGAAERREPVTEAVVAVWRCTRVWMMPGETALTQPRDYRSEPLRAVPRDQIEPRRPPRGRQKSTEVGVCGHD